MFFNTLSIISNIFKIHVLAFLFLLTSIIPAFLLSFLVGFTKGSFNYPWEMSIDARLVVAVLSFGINTYLWIIILKELRINSLASLINT